jgi:hypothetical protein
VNDHIKQELNDAHQALDRLGAPTSKIKRDARSGEDKEMTIGLGERLRWVEENWQPKPTAKG